MCQEYGKDFAEWFAVLYLRKDDRLILTILYVEELTTVDEAHHVFVGPHAEGWFLLAQLFVQSFFSHCQAMFPRCLGSKRGVFMRGSLARAKWGSRQFREIWRRFCAHMSSEPAFGLLEVTCSHRKPWLPGRRKIDLAKCFWSIIILRPMRTCCRVAGSETLVW